MLLLRFFGKIRLEDGIRYQILAPHLLFFLLRVYSKGKVVPELN
jgi:hypothetical protein